MAAAVLLISIALALKIGSGSIAITWGEIFDWMIGRPIDELHARVLGQIRMPRVLMGTVAGAILACAGVVFQALLRNPLAGPYTLGVSGGATLGAVIAISAAGSLGYSARLQSLPVISVSALSGAAVAITLIYVLARSASRFSTATIILAGMTLNLIFASLILLLEYLADYTQVYQMIRWMMGGLDVVGFGDFRLLGPVAVIGLAVIARSMRDLDLISFDPVTAATLGVRVETIRWRLLLTASLMTGCVVAFAGPIGFVGLIVPHCVRLVVGARHARVLPASVVVGAVFLLACDTLAQNILAEVELPVGIITAMLGGPFFVFLLLRRPGGTVVWGD